MFKRIQSAYKKWRFKRLLRKCVKTTFEPQIEKSYAHPCPALARHIKN